jgi:hypothetical protein
MKRVLVSVAVGVVAGVAVALVIGWGIAPVQYVDSPLHLLAQHYKDECTVMAAAAFQEDGDLNLAIERLWPLGVEDVANWVQDVTERYISQGRNVADIADLVALAEAFGKLTPSMEPYRLGPTPGGE